MNGDTVKKLDTRHPDSAEMLETWKKCEDVREGQTAIHKGGEKYLPRLSSQTADDYKAYKRRASFYGAMSRTVDAFIGMIMRVAPVVDQQSNLLDDVTGDKCGLACFIDEMLEESLVCGFFGVLVDHSPMPADGSITIAQAQQLGARPYLAMYDCHSILNWKIEKGVLTRVILEEDEVIQVSEFESRERCFFRVLDFDERGNYRQRKFIRSDKEANTFIQDGDDIYPLMSGSPLKQIPFYFVGDADELPPLIDLVDINISHYMTTADLENGCHFTGIPQPWVAGAHLKDGESLTVGGLSAWIFSDPQAKAEYLEFSGQGLGALEKRIELKEKQMAALGAKMLSDSVVAETATGSMLRSSGEFSILAKIADNTAEKITEICTFMHRWAGLPDVKIALNKDYFPAKMTPQELQALVQAWQSGAISAQTLFTNLQQGEIVAAGVNFEDEQAAIAETQPPAPQPAAATNGA